MDCVPPVPALVFSRQIPNVGLPGTDQLQFNDSINAGYSYQFPMGAFSHAGTYKTLPAANSNVGTLVVSTGTAAILSVAHIAAAGGWKSTFVLVNTGTAIAQAHLKLFDDNGNPLQTQLNFVQTGLNTVASQVDQAIAPDASLIVEMAGPNASPVQVGSAQLTSDGNVGGTLIFRYAPNGQESSIPFENRQPLAFVIPFDNTAGIVTGTAVGNVSPQTITVPVTLRNDSGQIVGTGSIPLAANGHTSFGLAAQFPGAANIRGTVQFDVPSGAQINVLGVRTPPSLTFTVLPNLVK